MQHGERQQYGIHSNPLSRCWGNLIIMLAWRIPPLPLTYLRRDAKICLMTSQTHATLLERLRDGADPMAWEDFFRRYWRLIYCFARKRGCSENTAQDILQDVMLSVFERRDVFRYDASRGHFRDWLATVVRNLVARHRRRPSERVHAVGGNTDQLDDVPDPVEATDPTWEAAFEESLLVALLDVVRQEVAPETYQAFELLSLGELRGSEVSAITGLSRNAAYLARKRVLARLRELGATYRDDGRLHERLRLALQSMPSPAAVRAITDLERKPSSQELAS
jgi:RNA polymerase sigma factor (sigma-70 family)